VLCTLDVGYTSETFNFIIMRVLIPANLNVEQMLKTCPPNIKNFKKHDLYYFLGLIQSVPANNKELTYGDYVPLYSKILQSINHDYKDYIRYLIYRGIWDCQKYTEGRSNAYRYTQKYASSRLVPYDITNRKAEAKALKAKENNLPAKYKHLAKHFDGLKIDVEAATKYVEEYTDFIKENPQYKKKKKKITTASGIKYDKYVTKRINPISFYGSSLFAIHSIDSKDFSLHVDSTGSRLHTPLTNMKRELRCFITYKGEFLVAIDIKNSQPYMALKLFDPDFYERKGKNQKLSLSSFDTNARVYCSIQSLFKNNIIMLVNSLLNPANTDVLTFANLVSEGTFYEYFMNKVEEQFGETITREVAKDTMFKVFFTGNGFLHQKEAKYKKVFAKEFPSVYKLFEFIKKGNKPLLAVLLQNIESKMILDVIAARIRKENPHIPLYTIHDSIVTTERYQKYVHDIMEEELTKHIGYKPSLKPEVWEPEFAYAELVTETRKLAA
jgi:hypothetical protein